MDVTAFHLAADGYRRRSRRWPSCFRSTRFSTFAAYPALLANALIDAGIPAFTPEIGAPRILDHEMIPASWKAR